MRYADLDEENEQWIVSHKPENVCTQNSLENVNSAQFLSSRKLWSRKYWNIFFEIKMIKLHPSAKEYKTNNFDMNAITFLEVSIMVIQSYLKWN